MKKQLIGSSASKEELAKKIGEYFYSEEPYELRKNADGTFAVHYPAGSSKAGKCLENFIAVNKKGRWRFELVKERS